MARRRMAHPLLSVFSTTISCGEYPNNMFGGGHSIHVRDFVGALDDFMTERNEA
jgi:hypothetical protein